MQETSTQKNWNDFYNPNRTKEKNYFWIVLLLLMLIGAATAYYNVNNNSNNNSTNTNNKNINSDSSATEIIGEALRDKKDTITNSISNRKGKAMADSINTIEDIFDNIHSLSTSELEQSISTIEYLNLSDDYNDFKKSMVQKIKYFIAYQNSGSSQYLDMFNEIDFLDELAKAFKKADVDYQLTSDNKIYYWYYD